MTGQLRLLSGRKVKSPNSSETRPTTSIVREALINIIGRKSINSSWLDLFSGTGIISCEALQAGAKKVVAIESDRITSKICRSNLILISNEIRSNSQIRAINADSLRWLKVGHAKQKEKNKNAIPSNKFDFVYLDPPYRSNVYSTVLKYLVLGNWINQGSLVICESSSLINIRFSNDWLLQDERAYGKSKLTFLTPSQG